MALISKSNNVVTLINVFTVEPHDQQRLVDLLSEATEAVMRFLPDFVSAPTSKKAETGCVWPTTPSGRAGTISRRCSGARRRSLT